MGSKSALEIAKICWKRVFRRLFFFLSKAEQKSKIDQNAKKETY